MTERTYDVMADEQGNPIKMWTRGVPVDEGAREQLKLTARMPFIHKWLAVMPDVHKGIGSTVGSVVPNLPLPAATSKAIASWSTISLRTQALARWV